jgi:D-ribose pyranose/furanose isomerase RbsD
MYPKFKDLVMTILLDEVGASKAKTMEYLDILLDVHIKVINTEHEEFKKVTKNMRHRGIQKAGALTVESVNVSKS